MPLKREDPRTSRGQQNAFFEKRQMTLKVISLKESLWCTNKKKNFSGKLWPPEHVTVADSTSQEHNWTPGILLNFVLLYLALANFK